MGRLTKDLGAVKPASRPPQRNFGTPIFAVPSVLKSPRRKPVERRKIGRLENRVQLDLKLAGGVAVIKVGGATESQGQGPRSKRTKGSWIGAPCHGRHGSGAADHSAPPSSFRGVSERRFGHL
jgi:hypothetical protein